MENKILTTNFHTHTTRCNHAAGEDRQYVEEAIKGGLKVLGFSDHSPYFFSGDYYSTFRMKREQVPGYVDSILALKKEYKDDIKIKLGFETEYYPKYFDKLLEFYSQYPIVTSLWGSILILNEEEHIYSGELHYDEDMMMQLVVRLLKVLRQAALLIWLILICLILAVLRKTMKRQQINCVLMQQRIRFRLKLIC